jgi:phosphoglycerate dehydrogenase-like enzyme
MAAPAGLAALRSTPMRIHIQKQPGDPMPAVTPRQWHEAASRAGEVGQGHEVSFGETAADLAAAIGEAEALITGDSVVLGLRPDEAPRLRLVFLMHAGVNALVPEAARLPPGITLLNNSGAHGDKAGEYVAMAVLMLANHLPRFVTQQGCQVWDRRFASVLAGRRATLVGLGALGGSAARRLRWFDLHVTGVRTRAEPHPDCDRVVATGDLDAVLPETEFLVLACPLTPRTRAILDRRRIGLLPYAAGVVNIGRGELVEQAALLDALDEGRLSGAVLDVFVPEPVPPGHRLWRTPNLVMTPHMSAGDPLTYNVRSLAIFLENLGALNEGRRPPNRVDLARGY